jgi:hypothetical protein
VLVAPGAGRAVRPDAGFADFSQRAFDSGPKLLELAEEVLAERRIGRFGLCHGMYTISYTYHGKEKRREKTIAGFSAVTEGLPHGCGQAHAFRKG